MEQSVNGEMLKYKRLVEAIFAGNTEKSECGGQCTCGKSKPKDECGIMKTEATPGKKGNTDLEKDMDLSKLDVALKGVEKKLDAGADLDKNDWKVIELSKKVSSNKPLTDEEIAWIFNVSKMYISKIEKGALEKAKSYIKRKPGLEDELKDTMRSEPRFKTHEPEAKEKPVVD